MLKIDKSKPIHGLKFLKGIEVRIFTSSEQPSCIRIMTRANNEEEFTVNEEKFNSYLEADKHVKKIFS